MHKTDRALVGWWAFLVALTVVSIESAWGAALVRDPAVAIAIVIGVALLKVRIVILRFMDVAEAPWSLRAPLEIWVVALATGILGLWYAAGA